MRLRHSVWDNVWCSITRALAATAIATAAIATTPISAAALAAPKPPATITTTFATADVVPRRLCCEWRHPSEQRHL